MPPAAGRRPVRHGLARVLSKSGICSRTQAAQAIRDGRVRLDGRVIRDPEHPITAAQRDRIQLDGAPLQAARHVVIALNKPRGVVTTAQDEQQRATVYACLQGSGLPWLAPVGRLDKASEGLLLMSNDPEWAAGITDPATHLDKQYHVRVRGVPSDTDLLRMQTGVEIDGESWRVKEVHLLRSAGKSAWLDIVLDEGRNRQIRRILDALGFEVLRLVRVRIGGVQLGDLGKGAWRELSGTDLENLRPDTKNP